MTRCKNCGTVRLGNSADGPMLSGETGTMSMPRELEECAMWMILFSLEA